MYDLNIYTLPTIDFVGGSTQDLRFKVSFYSNQKPFDLIGYTAKFSLIDYVNRRGKPIFDAGMSIADTETEDNGVANVLQVVLTPEQTMSLSGKFIYQITITKADTGETDIPKQGILYIINNISKV